EPPAKIPDGYSFQRYVLNGEDLPYPAEQGASGIIDTSGDSKIIVRNLKGYGLRMNKTWSDAEYMAEREPTYFAVFIDTGGTPSLVAGTVKQLAYAANPQTLYWYFLRLQPGTDFEQYVIREVLISGGTPAVDEEGNVTNAESLTIDPLPHGTEFSLSGKQKGETEASEFEYTVLYDEPGQQDNVRLQKVTNNRPGIILKKAQWNAAVPLAGAEFTLTDDDGNLIGTFTSDEDGLITVAFLRDDVPYTLTETHAPQGWYGLQAPLTITLSDHNISVAEREMSDYYIIDNLSATPSLTIKDRPYEFRAVKKDADTLEPLKGVKFALHKQVEVGGVITIDLNPMPGYESLSTDENGLIPKIDNTLPAGTYELREKSRLKGYDMISGYIRFTVSDTGAITLVGTDQQPIPEEASLTGPAEQPDGSLSYEMTIVNHRFADITLKKVDSSQAPLNGAKFKLCKYETSWEVVEEYENIDMTDSATARLADLPIGWYRLTETGAPAGYIIRDNQVYFKIAFDERGNVTVTLTDETGTGPGTNPDASVSGTAITVRNTPGAPLPNTGGSGTLPYTFGGIMLIIASALMYSFKMRRTGKEEK
ncbi:MAG: LPXTG cell wall anchor domain-containing protein, partial [Lachnospiraceae bacterium]|nr:LPXTG cell wall anchor domain-containing protein [Lachnospiraceae bacterium]